MNSRAEKETILLVGFKVPPALRQDWREWRGVVALFANEQTARHNVHPQRYAALYESLLATCLEQAGAVAETNWKFFNDLAQTVRPWVSVESLDNADPGILHELDMRCQHTDRQLNGAADGVTRRVAIVFLATMIVAMLASAAVMASKEYDLLSRIPKWVPRMFASAWNSVRYMNWKQQILVAGGVVALTTIPLVWRSARKY